MVDFPYGPSALAESNHKIKDTIFENAFQLTYNKLLFTCFKCDKGQKILTHFF